MSITNLPPLSRRMCEVLCLLFESEKPWQLYATIASGASEAEDHAFEAEMKALQAYFRASISTEEQQ